MDHTTTTLDASTPLPATIAPSGRTAAPRWRLMLWYGTFVLAANPLWEVAHLPLYTLWRTGSRG